MISIIICSVNNDYLQNIKNNIAETIGTEYEIIAYDNRHTNHVICHVYNLCAAKAKFPYLCFVHEDVELLSKDWGKELIAYIQ